MIDVTAVLRAVAAPRRQAILRLVWNTERSAGEIAAAIPDVTFSAVSQHLRVLHEAGLLDQRRDGRRRLYVLRHETLGPLAAFLETQWHTQLDRLKTLAEDEELCNA